jgi:hypothetical protein
MSSNKVLPLVSIIFVFNLLACKNGDAAQTKMLIGNWVIMYSEMNGQPNSFMNNGFMHFDGQKVKTNIFGTEDTFPFTYDGTTLFIDGIEKLEMEVSKHTLDSISIRGKVRTFEMKFGLKKS